MTTSGFFETVEARFHDWHYDHPRILYSLMRSLKPRVAIECGSYRGYAACYMARALQENNSGHLFCIDNFSLNDYAVKHGIDPKQHWHDNLMACGVAGWVTLLQGDSDKVDWPERVDFAYIDGWHSYDATKHDFDQCAKRGAQCICLDDTINCAGPRLLMNEVKWKSEWSVLDVPSDNGLSICMRKGKVRDVTFSQELPNHPGVDVSVLSPAERKKHFDLAHKSTGLDYFEPGIGLPS